MSKPVQLQLRVIPRPEHCVSRSNISHAARKVLYRLHEAGFASFLVGGAVRDLLLGRQPKDFDVATDATPEQVKRLFRNCRLIGRRFRLAHVVFGREIIEVATFRGNGGEDTDGGEGDRHIVDGRIVRDNIWGSIEEDALRRDFRVNALYYDISDFSVRDYVGGVSDLEQRELHLIGDPEQRYREDPVRMLRAARLAAKLQFTVGEDAAAEMLRLGGLLTEAAPARLFDESLKLFLAGHGGASLCELRSFGLLEHLFPATEKALRRETDGVFAGILEKGLESTDRRVREDKPTTPAFLFALLLWGEVRHRAERLIEQGENLGMAWQSASAAVLAEQTRRVAIPRRFVYAMEEIWALQLRFADRRRNRVFRLMSHPRFRAAYDFLLLRSHESEAIAELGRWWTRAQEVDAAELTEELEQKPEAPEAPADQPEVRRKRRRRRRKATPADNA